MSDYMLVEIGQELMEVVAKTKYDDLQSQLAQCEREKLAAVQVYEDFKRGFEEARQQLAQCRQERQWAIERFNEVYAEFDPRPEGQSTVQAIRVLKQENERLRQELQAKSVSL